MHLLYDITDHLLGHFKIRNHPLDKRTGCRNICGSAANHLFCFISNRNNLPGFLIYGDNGGFVNNDAFSAHIHKGIRGTQIYAYVFRKNSEKIIDHIERLFQTYSIFKKSFSFITIAAFSPLFFTSTPFFSRFFSETTTRHGIPIKSASANFSPADKPTRSSYNTSAPFATKSPYIFSASFLTVSGLILPGISIRWTRKGEIDSGHKIPRSSL